MSSEDWIHVIRLKASITACWAVCPSLGHVALTTEFQGLGKMAQWVKCLLRKHVGLSSALQHPWEKPGVAAHAYSPSLVWRWEDLEGSLANVSSHSERPCLKTNLSETKIDEWINTAVGVMTQWGKGLTVQVWESEFKSQNPHICNPSTSMGQDGPWRPENCWQAAWSYIVGEKQLRRLCPKR